MKLFIFDLDGVLVDACEWHRVSLNKALKEICNYEISDEDHKNIYNGTPTKIKLKKLNELGIVKLEDFEKISELKQFYTIQLIEDSAKQRQEKIELMRLLKENNKIICCYTNSIKKTAYLMLEKTGIKNFFDLIITNEDVTNPKPDPEGYLLCMNKLGVNKESTVIVEDSEKGIEAAILSGANVIAVKDQDEVEIKLLEKYIK